MHNHSLLLTAPKHLEWIAGEIPPLQPDEVLIQAFELLQGKMQHEGRICILADGNVEPLVIAPAFHEKELMLIGSSDGWDYQEHARWYFQFVKEHAHDLELIFDYVTTQHDLAATFEQLALDTISPTKVLVRYT
jgi:alcohol dehydrogenase